MVNKFTHYKLLAVAVVAAAIAACNSGSSNPSTVSNTTPTVYIADYGNYDGLPNVYQYTYNNETFSYVGTITPPPGESSFISPIAVAYNNGYAYIVDDGAAPNGAIYIYSAANNGNLTYAESVALPNNDHPEGIVFNASGNFAYIPDYESGGIWTFSIGANGTLKNAVQTAPIGGYNQGPTEMAGNISINNGFLYTTSNRPQDITHSGIINIYTINPNASITASESQQFYTGYASTNIAFVNGIAFIGNNQGDYIISYPVSPTDGTLTNVTDGGNWNYTYYNPAYDSYSYGFVNSFNGYLYASLYEGENYNRYYQTAGFNSSYIGTISYNPAYDLPYPTGESQLQVTGITTN